jgi:hypothetical protein
MPEGATWPAGRTLFLQSHASFPAIAPDEKCRLTSDIRLMEGLISIDDEPFAASTASIRAFPSRSRERTT